MSRTIKDCINEATIPIPDTSKIPFTLAWFSMTMAGVLVACADVLASTDFPQMSPSEFGGGKRAESPGAQEIISVLNAEDLARHTPLAMQTHFFLSWLLNQNEPENELWCAPSWIGKKWNEYAKMVEEGNK